MVFKKLAAASGLAAWLMLMGGTAQAQNQNQDLSSITAPLGQTFKVPHLVAKEQTRVIFYRDKAASKTGFTSAVSLYVNGAYLASIQQAAFTELCFTPGQAEVSARHVQNDAPPLDGVHLVNSLKLEGGEDVFVKVINDVTGQLVMMVMRPEFALPELVHTRRQIHTISRVPGTLVCEDRNKKVPQDVVVPASPLRRATLSADALFAFGKSGIDGIPLKGRRLLDHLVDRIKSEFGDGKDVRIHIVGHADRFGTEAGNLRISKERAGAIKNYFVKSGLLASGVTTEGRGDKEPVLTTCGVAYTQTNVVCNKPNRRVDLEIRSQANLEASK